MVKRMGEVQFKPAIQKLEVDENDWTKPIEMNKKQVKDLKKALKHYRGLGKSREVKTKEGSIEFRLDENGKYELKLTNDVGLIKLPVENPPVIEILPKFNIDIWGMLNFIITNRFKVNFKELIESDAQKDLVLIILKLYVERLLQFWLTSKKYTYQEKIDDLDHVRGKIDVFRTKMNIIQFKPAICCKYEEFTLDQPFNQVLKYALSLVREQLKVNRSYREQLEGKMKRLWEDMVTVTNQPFRVVEIDNFDYNNLNRHYYEMHQLAKIVIENGFAAPRIGKYHLYGVLINTWRMLEDFIHELFIKNLSTTGIEVTYQETFTLKTNTKMTSIFDFVLKTDEWWAICDTKYKKTLERTDYRQISDYATHIRDKQFREADQIPDKVSYVFIFPTDDAEVDIDVVNYGIYKIIRAPIKLDSRHLRDDKYLKDEFLGKLIEIINQNFNNLPD